MASFYTTVIEVPPPPDVAELPSEEIFPQTRFKISLNPTFGEIHALWANLNGIKAMEDGDRTLQVLQGQFYLAAFHLDS